MNRIINPRNNSRETTKQNVSFSELVEWSSTNPNKSKKLSPIEINKENLSEFAIAHKDESHVNTLESIKLPQFESCTLTPSGILSAIAWMSDSTYPYLSVSSRHSYLRTMATDLQEKTDTLQGTALGRKRRKIHDGIGSLANGSLIKPEDWIDLFSSLAIMKNIQIIFIKMSKVEIKTSELSQGRSKMENTLVLFEGNEGEEDDDLSDKKVYFSSDPHTWSAGKKIWIADYHARWIASPLTDSSLESLPDWIDDLEINGWDVNWFLNNGETKEDIVKQLSGMSTWQTEHSKLKKDTLARRLAKYRAIEGIENILKSHLVSAV